MQTENWRDTGAKADRGQREERAEEEERREKKRGRRGHTDVGSAVCQAGTEAGAGAAFWRIRRGGAFALL